MTRALLAIAALVPGTGLTADKDDPKPGKTPAAEHLCNETGNVKYAARWTAGKVTLTAQGTHHTGGWTVSLNQRRIEIFPPQFDLMHKRPTGIVTQAITPFNVSATFAAAEKPARVTVHDAQGAQKVPVE